MPTNADNTPIATFAATSYREVVSCRVCGRSLLLGERSIGFFTAAGEGPWEVCELCVPRAHRYGLRPRPSTADEVSRARRAGSAGRMLVAMRRVFGRSSDRRDPRAPVHGTAAVAAKAAAASTGRRARRRGAGIELDPAMLGTLPVGSAAIPMALAAFNQSPHARTLAGLHRTLGAPRASVAPRSATDREVIITVAWEIVWYQFRIMPDGIEQQRGTYLSELQSRWQRWNCDVAPDGTIHEPGAGSDADGQEAPETSPSEGPAR